MCIGMITCKNSSEPTGRRRPGRVEEVVSRTTCALSITESTSIRKRTLNAIVRPSPSISAWMSVLRSVSGYHGFPQHRSPLAPVESTS